MYINPIYYISIYIQKHSISHEIIAPSLVQRLCETLFFIANGHSLPNIEKVNGFVKG
jgi:hypothetical protein